MFVVNKYQPLSDLVELLGVVDDDLDSHLHLGFLQAEVQACDLGVDYSLHHAFVMRQKNKGQQQRMRG